MKTSNETSFVRAILAAAILMMILSAFMGHSIATAEEVETPVTGYEDGFDFINEEYNATIILDDPAYFSEEEVTTPTDLEEGTPTAEMDAEATATPEPVTTEQPEPTSEPEPTKKPRKSKRQPMLYDIPQELLDADPVFAAIMAEAEKYIGYPYVYGGSKPSTSFDCSGFVSWVYTQSGACNTGRKGANGLHRMCEDVAPEDARPGDLIFFHGTMGPDVKGITHVGIYVGNNMMIHCGDPIGYVDLTEEKWVKRFDCFGRLPLTEGVPTHE